MIMQKKNKEKLITAVNNNTLSTEREKLPPKNLVKKTDSDTAIDKLRK